MKKISRIFRLIIYLLIVAFLVPAKAYSQNPFSGLTYDKFSDTTENITKDNFQKKTDNSSVGQIFYINASFEIESAGGELLPYLYLRPINRVAVEEGADITFEFYNESSCADLLEFRIDGLRVFIGGRNTYTFTNVTQNHSIQILYGWPFGSFAHLAADKNNQCGPFTTNIRVVGDASAVDRRTIINQVEWWKGNKNTGEYLGSGLDLANVGPGFYTAEIWEKCGDRYTSSIEIKQKPTPNSSSVITNATCPLYNDGSINIEASGGNGTFLYSINNGETYSANNTFTGLAANNYQVIVKSDGCVSSTKTITIGNNPITNYHSKSSGELHLLSSWGVNPDGSGANPVDFGTCKTFHLANRFINPPGFGSYDLTADWSVEGKIAFAGSSTIPTTLNLNGYTLTSGGFETDNPSSKIGVLNGSPTSSLILKGTTGSQSLNFIGYAQDRLAQLKNLTIDYPGATAILQNPLDIFGTLDVKNGTLTSEYGTNFSGAYSLTLKSNEDNTARVAPISTGNIVMKVTVERFIPARRAWRLLCAPINGLQTINQAWQENPIGPVPNPVPENSSYSGFGTIITGGTPANGFDDNNGAGYSILQYFGISNRWNVVPSTIRPVNGGPFMVYVRGDRTIPPNIRIAPNNTTLRATGALWIGNQSIPVAANTFTAISNPYASPIDFKTITKNGIGDYFYAWDPFLGGSFGEGSYMLVYANEYGSYTTIPKPSISVGITMDQYIQSGQGFLVYSSFNTSLVIKETDKSAVPAVNNFKSSNPEKGLRVALQTIENDNTTAVTDEAFTTYGGTYANDIDAMDIFKLSNIKENLGLARNGKELMLERRQIIAGSDTIFLKMWNLEKKAYLLRFTPENISSLPCKYGYLADNYLNSIEPISLAEPTSIKFKVDGNDASFNAQRFMVILSNDKLSEPITSAGSFKVTPNPINGRSIQLQFINQPQGRYNIQLVNSLGQVMYKNQVQHTDGSESVTLTLKNNIAKGPYQLHISNSGNNFKTTIQVFK